MTRRERLESKLSKRLEWADKAAQRADARFKAADPSEEATGIPLGQPILVGHHSEGRHRRVVERLRANMQKGVEESKLAAHHAGKAAGLEAQLDSTIYSDDPDAIEALKEKARVLTAKRDAMTAANKYWRKHKSMQGFPGMSDAVAARLDADIPQRYSWEQQPYAPYQLTNLSAKIRQAKKRIEEVERRQQTTEAASAAGGVLIQGEDYIAVTFAEKPTREVLNALKAADFHWSGGSWCGYRSKLPASI